MPRVLLVVLLAVLTSCATPNTQESKSQGTPSGLVEDKAARGSSGAPRPTEPKFQTYDEATEYVRRTYPRESIDTSRSSWITGAEYYEAEGRGYLILGMKGRDYIFAGVPRDVWEGFKSAPSLGKYYNSEIRGRYRFDLRGTGR